MAQLKSRSVCDVTTSSSSHQCSAEASKAVVCPGHDEYNKATQTVETAFVPCEGCHLVQQSLRDAANTVVTTCEALSLQSHVARYQATVRALDWLAGTSCSFTLLYSNVCLLASEQCVWNSYILSVSKREPMFMLYFSLQTSCRVIFFYSR